MGTLSSHPFWLAIVAGDTSQVHRLLTDDPALASRDFRPIEEQDPHTHGFPLVKACELGHLEVAELLLGHGADVDARSPAPEQRELGLPLMLAVQGHHYELAHLLLDHGASLDAHGWCAPCVVEELYRAACAAGAPIEMARPGFRSYLGEVEAVPLAADAPEVVRLFDRALALGGQPSLECLVWANYLDLLEELLRTCPDAPGTRHDHPHGTVFANICDAASWGGFPRVLELATSICPQLHTPDDSVRALTRALVSHNRFGAVGDYRELIEAQLDYLEDKGALPDIIQEGKFLPHYLLAAHYLWPAWSGEGESKSSVSSMIELAELFRARGFIDLSRTDGESGKSALDCARDRSEHPGLDTFAAYLEDHGARSANLS